MQAFFVIWLELFRIRSSFFLGPGLVDVFFGWKTLVVDDGLILKAKIVLAGLVDLCCQFLIGAVLFQIAARGGSNDCLLLESVVISVVVVFYGTEVESIGLSL